jgi:hypothetical protein
VKEKVIAPSEENMTTTGPTSEKSQKTNVPQPSSLNSNKQGMKKGTGKNENNLKLDPKNAVSK